MSERPPEFHTDLSAEQSYANYLRLDLLLAARLVERFVVLRRWLCGTQDLDTQILVSRRIEHLVDVGAQLRVRVRRGELAVPRILVESNRDLARGIRDRERTHDGVLVQRIARPASFDARSTASSATTRQMSCEGL